VSGTENGTKRAEKSGERSAETNESRKKRGAWSGNGAASRYHKKPKFSHFDLLRTCCRTYCGFVVSIRQMWNFVQLVVQQMHDESK